MPEKILFNKPCVTGVESDYLNEAVSTSSLSGDGIFSRRCQEWFDKRLNGAKSLLTPSCTHALEMAAILIGIQPGDEVILPSYTFVSTVNSFVLRGAVPVFVDIRTDTKNIDETLIERAITKRTRAIVVVHYAGVACEMDSIITIANKYGLFVIEDAAQAMMSTYKDRPLGSIGDIGAYSFHATKNYTSGGEGGLLIVNNPIFKERADIIREKGTNRSQFLRGSVDKYTWVDIGSSYLPSDLQAAYLLAQLDAAAEVNKYRLSIWERYSDAFSVLSEKGIGLPPCVDSCQHNAHMFYLLARSLEERDALISYLKEGGVAAAFHYVPLHSTEIGVELGRFCGDDLNTTDVSNRLLRLPLYYNLTCSEVDYVIALVLKFYSL